MDAASSGRVIVRSRMKLFNMMKINALQDTHAIPLPSNFWPKVVEPVEKLEGRARGSIYPWWEDK